MACKVASTASPEPIGVTEGAPMLIQSPPGTRLRLRPAPGLHSLTHSLTSTANRTSFTASSGGLVRLGPASDTAPDQQHPRADRSRFNLDHIT